jgi:hypothetical protein
MSAEFRTAEQIKLGETLAKLASDTKFEIGSNEKIILEDSKVVQFPGFPYTFQAVGERILVSVDIPLTGYECKVCKGKKKVEIKGEFVVGEGRKTDWQECPECHGIGGLIVLPSESKRLPTHGVVLSMGAIAREKAEFKVGDRVLFGEHTGTMIPTAAGLMFKYLDWYGVALVIGGAEELAAFDFILSDK